MKFINILWPGLLAAACITGCQKKLNYDPETIKADLELSLKSAASFEVGVGLDYDGMINNTAYVDIVKSQFSVATPGYLMKHGAIVQNNGALNFTKADAFVNTVTS